MHSKVVMSEAVRRARWTVLERREASVFDASSSQTPGAFDAERGDLLHGYRVDDLEVALSRGIEAVHFLTTMTGRIKRPCDNENSFLRYDE